MHDETRRLFAALRVRDIDAVRRLLAAGADPRRSDGREMPIHVAARRGPLALVEALLEGGALEWERDARGRSALDVARAGRARERAAIVALLDRPCIDDPSFRAAVAAIHAGDVRGLEALLDAEPHLLHVRAVEPDVYRRVPRQQYFLDPKLFWFVANNPTLVPRVAPNVVDVANAMIARGVDATDLNYALELTMSGASARESGVQDGLIAALVAAGATATPAAIEVAAGHRETGALESLLRVGYVPTPAMFATLGDAEALRTSLATASPAEIGSAFGLAVINERVDAARVALDAGADVGAYLPVHAHGTALHQAAISGNVELIELLIERGASTDVRDTLWNATPLEWASFGGRTRAREALRAASHGRGRRARQGGTASVDE